MKIVGFLVYPGRIARTKVAASTDQSEGAYGASIPRQVRLAERFHGFCFSTNNQPE